MILARITQTAVNVGAYFHVRVFKSYLSTTLKIIVLIAYSLFAALQSKFKSLKSNSYVLN